MPESITSHPFVPKKWVIENLSLIAQNKNPVDKLNDLFKTVLDPRKPKSLAATDATLENITTLFDISDDIRRDGKPWKLQSESYEVPKRLKDNLDELSKVLYDDSVEATSRIAIDLMLIACMSHVMELYPTHFSRKKQKVASRPGTPQDFEDRERIMIYPEVDVALDVIDPKTKEKTHVTGRADWALGYTGPHDTVHGTFLVAIAKRRALFSTGEAQL